MHSFRSRNPPLEFRRATLTQKPDGGVYCHRGNHSRRRCRAWSPVSSGIVLTVLGNSGVLSNGVLDLERQWMGKKVGGNRLRRRGTRRDKLGVYSACVFLGLGTAVPSVSVELHPPASSRNLFSLAWLARVQWRIRAGCKQPGDSHLLEYERRRYLVRCAMGHPGEVPSPSVVINWLLLWSNHWHDCVNIFSWCNPYMVLFHSRLCCGPRLPFSLEIYGCFRPR